MLAQRAYLKVSSIPHGLTFFASLLMKFVKTPNRKAKTLLLFFTLYLSARGAPTIKVSAIVSATYAKYDIFASLRLKKKAHKG